MNLTDKLDMLKRDEYVVNSKFHIVVHLPLHSWYDFDLVFLADNGTNIVEEHIQNKIKTLKINHRNKTASIEWM